MTDCFFLIYRPIDNNANDQTVHGYYHGHFIDCLSFCRELSQIAVGTVTGISNKNEKSFFHQLNGGSSCPQTPFKGQHAVVFKLMMGKH